jgi:hypothetical protein
MIREKRARIEARLMKVMESDLVKDFAIIEMCDHHGKQVGKIVGVDWAAVRASDSSAIVSKFKFDAKTGRLVDFERDDAMNAIAQLRDMHGFKAVTKVAPTSPDGKEPFAPPEMSDNELARRIALVLTGKATLLGDS